MPWITKTETKYKDDGRPYTVQSTVWVAPVSGVPLETRESLRKEHLPAARKGPTPAQIRAETAKKKAEAAKKQKALKHQAWLDLGSRVGNIMASMMGKTAVKPAPAVSSGQAGSMSSAERLARQKAADALNKQRVIEQGIKKAKEMSPAEEMRLQKLHGRNQAGFDKAMAERADRILVAEAPTKGADKATGTELERILKDRRQRQVNSNGRDLDTEFVTKVQDAYNGYLDEVQKKFAKVATKVDKQLNSFFVVKNGKSYWKSPADRKAGLALMKSSGYNDMLAEHIRLFGKGPSIKDPYGDGSVREVMTASEQISRSQALYIRDAAKSAFLGNDPHNISSRYAEWNRSEQWLYEVDVKDIDPLTTTWDASKKRRRTPQEEYDFRKVQFRAEVSRRQNESMAMWSALAGIKAAGEGVRATPMGKEYAKREQRLVDASARLGIDMGEAGKDEGLREQVVNDALKEWERENKSLYDSATPVVNGHHVVAPGMVRENVKKFADAKEAERKRLYALFHATPPHLLSSAMSHPILRPAMEALGVTSSLAGAGIRATAYMTTGSATINFPVTLHDLPPEVQKQAWAAGQANIDAIDKEDPFAILHAANVANSPQTWTQEWLKTTQGMNWAKKFYAERQAKDMEELRKFTKAMYVDDTGIYDKVKALNEFGATPTSDPITNMLAQFGLDVSVAMPMNLLTYPARIRRVLAVTKGLGKVEAAATAFIEFQRVTESELRFHDFVKPYLKRLGAGEDAEKVSEDILQAIAGIPKGEKRAKFAGKILEDMGVDMKKANGELLLNLVQQEAEQQFKKAGIDFRALGERAKTAELETRRLEREARDEVSKNLDVADEKTLAIRKAAEEAHVAAEEKLHLEYETRTAPLEARAAAQPVERVVSDAALERQGMRSVAEEVATPPLAHPLGHTDEVIVKASARDTLRSVLNDLRTWRKSAKNEGRIADPNAGQVAADLHQALTGTQDLHWVDEAYGFSPGKFTDDYLSSTEYLTDRALAQAHIVEPQILTEGARKARAGHEVFVTDEVREAARNRIYQAARQSQAINLREAESVNRPKGMPSLVEGKIPWEERFTDTGEFVTDAKGKPAKRKGRTTAYNVAGGLKSWQQYITSSTDLLLARMGAKTVGEEALLVASRRAYEKIKRELVSARAKFESGRFGQEQYDAELERISGYGIELKTGNLTVDMRSHGGYIVNDSGVDHIRYGKGFIRLGEELVDEFVAVGDLNHHYETLSLLPEMMEGPGMKTSLMAQILEPAFRNELTGSKFARMLERAMFNENPNPANFRAGMSHLFALFHLTMLDAKTAAEEAAYLKERIAQVVADGGESAELRAQLKVAKKAQTRAVTRLKKYSEIVELKMMETGSEGIERGEISGYRVQQARKRLAEARTRAADKTLHPSEQEAAGAELRKAQTALTRSVREFNRYKDEAAKSVVVRGGRGAVGPNEGNLFLRGWKVMESRAGVAWADDFAVSEGAFIAAAVDEKFGHVLHPHLAMAMIPYGPISRNLPITHGFTGYLRNLASTMNDMFRMSDPRWKDLDITKQLTKIARGKEAGEGVTIASQIAHYVASRYGAPRRASFANILQDFNIEATWMAGKGYITKRGKVIRDADPAAATAIAKMRDEYITRMAPIIQKQLRREVDTVGTAPFFPGIRADAEVSEKAVRLAGDEFDKLFELPNRAYVSGRSKGYKMGIDEYGNPIKVEKRESLNEGTKFGVGKQRRDFPQFLRDWYDDRYWRGEVTHGNAGLHTAKFLEKMADPFINRGDSYVAFTRIYWRHMVGAGAENEARVVIRTLFEDKIYYAYESAFDALHGIDGAHPVGPEHKLGHVYDLFYEVGLMRDPETILAEGLARAERQRGLAEMAEEEQLLHDDLLAVEQELKKQQEDYESPFESEAMYDNATIDNVGDALDSHTENFTQSLTDIRRLTHGATAFDDAVEGLKSARAELDVIEARVARVRRNTEPIDRRLIKKPYKELGAARRKVTIAQKKAEALLERAKVEAAAERAAVEAENELAAARKSVSTTADELKAVSAKAKQARADFKALIEHKDSARRVTRKGGPRPNDMAMDSYFEDIKAIGDRPMRKGTAGVAGDEDNWMQVRTYIKTKVPAAHRPWVYAEVRQRAALKGLTKTMNILVHRTMDMDAIPSEVGRQMEEAIATVRAMPGGEEFINDWASKYHQNLLQSRLIDYLKNEEWFKFSEAHAIEKPRALGDVGEAVLADPVMLEPGRLTARLRRLTDDLARGKKGVAYGEGKAGNRAYKHIDLTEAERAAMEAELKELPRQIEEAQAARYAFMEAEKVGERAAGDLSDVAQEISRLESQVASIDKVLAAGKMKQGRWVKFLKARQKTAFARQRENLLAQIDDVHAQRKKELEVGRDLPGRQSADRAPSEADITGRIPAPGDDITELRAPTPDELENDGVTMSHQALEMLGAMNEDDWLARELMKAQRKARLSKGATKHAAVVRVREIQKAQRVKEVVKSGKPGTYVTGKARKTSAATLRNVAGERAKMSFAAKMIAPFVFMASGHEIEQARTLWSMLRNAGVEPGVRSRIREVGDVTETYKTHGAAIESELAVLLPKDLLVKNGFPPDLMDGIKVTAFVTGLEEFGPSLKNPEFARFARQVQDRADARIRAIAGADYGLEEWKNDRLFTRGDHYNIREWEQHETGMSNAISAERYGERRQTRTDLAGKRGMHEGGALAEMVENDVRAMVAKAKYADEHGIDLHRWNEARKVFRGSYLKKKYGRSIAAQAHQRANEAMEAIGKRADSPDYQKKYDAVYEKEYLSIRKSMADEEALKQLQRLGDEMRGATFREITEEFERRYGMDNELRGRAPGPITLFQQRTLEEAVKELLQVDSVDDIGQMAEALGRHGQKPPFENAQEMSDWLVRYGFWSKRTSDAIESGARSWSLDEESKYWKDHWGSAPPWADRNLWAEGQQYHHLIYDARARGEQFREWGLFNRNMEARFATGKLTRHQRARLMIEGSIELGIKGKRDLWMERRYVMERYGDMVQDPAGNLTAFPELMNKKELETHMVRVTSDASIPKGFTEDLEELELMHQLIAKHVGKLVKRYTAGETLEYADMFEHFADITTDMMMDPIWLKRDRDAVGRILRGQAAFRRSLVFTQLGFFTTNVIDTTIKGPWTKFITRSFHSRHISEAAMKITLEDLGWKPQGQLLHDVTQGGTKRWDEIGKRTRYYVVDGVVREETVLEKALADVVQVALGASELPLQGAGMAEDFTKLRLAQGMYDGVYREAFQLVGDEKLAHNMALGFVSKEASRLWPTSGDGPIEQLLNQISPFASYQVKNRIVFLGEFASNPFLFNYFDHIGDAIEKYNRARWKAEGKEHEYTDVEARLIELPWAPGTFIDLGTWSDAQRGLKPLYDISNGKATVGSLASQFVRLAGPNDINFVFGLMNAMDFGLRQEWVMKRDANGDPTGEWEQVEVPWEAPWGGEANWVNSFWPIEVKDTYDAAAMDGQWTPGEITNLAYQIAFFGGLKQHDRGAGLSSYYYALKKKDPAAAKKFLLTPEGKSLKMWWADKAANSYTGYTPQEMREMADPSLKSTDTATWFHSQSKEFQNQIKRDLDDLNLIHRKWNNVLWKLTPGTPEYAKAKLDMSNERFAYISAHPEYYDYYAFSMSPDKWAKEYDSWVVDDGVSTFYNMEAPRQGDLNKNGKPKYKTAEEWQKAVGVWKGQRDLFLRENPKVAERIATYRTSIEEVWRQTEQHWFDILDRIGTRSIAIEAAKASKDFKLSDQLYLANDLDWAQLNEDESVQYFDPTTDFKSLGFDENGKELQGPRILRQDPFGNPLLRRTKLFPDFNRWRYDRADALGKAKIERDTKYAELIGNVVKESKKAKNFGAKFVQLVKADPWLMSEYFKRNPGKKEAWGKNDDYFNLISKFGKLMRAGKFDEGHRYFENLPDWVKNQYYNNNPKKRGQRMRSAQTLQYMNYMKRWTDYYKKRDYAGGAAFFDKMPKWVKDRYYSKHPDGFGKGGGGGGTGSSPYSRAMGKWVALLQGGDKDAAKEYFDSMPKAFRDRYYVGHPEAKLRDNVKRVGQLATYFGSDDANRIQYLHDNPDFAAWLKSQGDSDQTRRMMITQAYRAIPKGDQWMKQVFREKFPEIFSPEGVGEQALKKVYTDLAEHPEFSAGFEKWLAEIWKTYAENMQHAGARPKPLESIHQREHGMVNRQRPHGGKSAAWVRLHSLS